MYANVVRDGEMSNRTYKTSLKIDRSKDVKVVFTERENIERDLQHIFESMKTQGNIYGITNPRIPAVTLTFNDRNEMLGFATAV